ncbi:hypothetical protein LCGC14_2611430, partial [marine sediment metagenome]
VESEANDALVAQKLDHLVAVADGDDVVNNSIIARLADSGATADWSTYVQTTDSLRAIRDRGDAEWITATGFALASVLGALGDAAAAGDPTSSDTVMKYIKQLINVLVGTAGVGTYPAEAAPANAVNLAEVLRAIHADVATDGVVVASINTDAIDKVALEGTIWDELLDYTAGVDTNLTLRQHFRLAAAALYGKASGLATTTALYRNIPDDVNAITATVDADGNRSAVTLDKT